MVTVRKIISGKKRYYYLEHTLRKGKLFKNERVYLGKSLPKNIEKLKEKFLNDLFEKIYAKELINARDKFNKEYRQYPESYKEKYIESFMIKFTYNTNRIEGGTLTLKETADLLQERVSPRNKTIEEVKETENHKRVFYEMLSTKEKLKLSTVLYWHKILFEDSDTQIAGRIRKHPVSIARSKTELSLPAELDSLLHDFFKWYNNAYGKINPVFMAALVHLKFVSIHPFSDGNGRISRIMMNHTLSSQNYPMLNINYTNRNAYYTALERSQTQKKGHIFIQYLVKRYLKEYKK